MTHVSGRMVEAGLDDSQSRDEGNRNRNPPGIGFLALLKEDLRVHGGTIFEQGFWAIAVHRFGNWRLGAPRLFQGPLGILYRLMFLFVECAAGISLPYDVTVGRRVRIWHHSGIILLARSIGDDVQIRQNTTMGVVSVDRPRDIPTIGNRVDIGCGACLLGGITIGDDSKIGANAVVITDVPPGSTAVGIPARIIRREAPEVRS